MRCAVAPWSALPRGYVNASHVGRVRCVAVARPHTTRRDGEVAETKSASFRRVHGMDSTAHRRGVSAHLSALPDASVLTLLATCAAVGKLAEEHTRVGAAVSAPLVAMGAAIALATLGILPSASWAYDLVWDHLMPLAVALSLLGAPIDRIAVQRGSKVLIAFTIGAIGTVVGTFVAYKFVGHLLGPHAWKIAACLCASYVGGSLNYASTAQALGLGVTPGGQAALAAGMAADNLAMAVFLAALALVKAAKPGEQKRPGYFEAVEVDVSVVPQNSGTETSSPVTQTTATLACAFAGALVVLEIGQLVASWIGFPAASLAVASIAAAVVSFTAIFLSKRDASNRFMKGVGFPESPFAGSEQLGATLMLLFFATLGARADPTIAMKNGAPTFAFIAVQLSSHFLFTFLIAGKVLNKVLKLPLWATLTASNACVGGPATAAAAAAARGWPEAVQSAVVAGTVGYVLGTPLACAVAAVLRGMIV